MVVKRAQEHLSKGSEVEVSSNEEGYRGAWFSAIILDPDPSNPTPTRKRKSFSNSYKVLVQYDTLVSDDDPNKALTELIDVGHIRPRPPPDNAAKRFYIGDVVDAFHLDAWWPGVVIKFEDGEYTVGFKSPPDLLVLRPSDLRLHWDLEESIWSRPLKEIIKEFFSPGTAVEVNLNKEQLFCSWVSAIYLGHLGNDSVLLQYKSANNCDVKVVVCHHQIRPQPPELGRRDFSLMEVVDAFHDEGWCFGEITKVLTGNKYMVRLKFTGQEKECSQSELRPHMQVESSRDYEGRSKHACESFINYEQVQSSRDYEVRSKHACESFRNYEVATPLESSGGTKDNTEEKTPCSRISGKNQMEHLSRCIDRSPYGKTKKKLKMSQQPNDDATILSLCKKSKRGHSGDSLSFPQFVSRRSTVKMRNKEAPVTDGVKTEQQKVGKLDNQGIVSFERKGKKDSEIEKADEEDVGHEHVMDMESSGIRSESEVTRGSHAGTSCLHPMEEVEQQNEDGLSSEIKGEGKLPALLVECSKDPATDCMNDILGLPVTARFDLTGEKHNGTGVAAQVELTETQVMKDKGSEDAMVEVEAVDSAMDIEKVVERIIKCSSNPAGISNQQNEARGRQFETGVTGDIEQEDGSEEAMRETEAVDSAMDYLTKEAHDQPLSLCIDEMPSVKTIEGSSSQGALGEAETEDFAILHSTKEVEAALAGISVKTSAHDQPFSLSTDEMHSVKTTEGSSNPAATANQKNEVRGTQVETGVTGNIEHQDSPHLPFVKSSPVWETIESMDVFKKHPQKPHFHPLVKSREVCREGLAIGHMVTFASLIEKTSKLQVGDPRDFFDSCVEELVELEMSGFDVKAVRHCLNTFLEMKVKLGQLQVQSKEVETQLVERTHDRNKHNEIISEIDKEIKDLQERRTMLMTMDDAKGTEISRLQTEANFITNGIQTIHHDFEKLAAATL